MNRYNAEDQSTRFAIFYEQQALRLLADAAGEEIMALSRLMELEEEAQKCIRCSLCKMIPMPVIMSPKYTDGCPANREFHFHGYSGSGKQIMAFSLTSGRIKADRFLSEIVYACTACGMCDVVCKFTMEAERHLVNMALREHMVDEGLTMPIHDKMIENLEVYGHPEGRPPKSPGNWADGLSLKVLPDAESEVLIFAGCMQSVDPALARTARRLARILIEAGVDVGILGDLEPSCGLTAYWTGYRDVFASIADKTVSLLDSLNVKTIVTVSGSCLGSFRSKYPEYSRAPGTEVLHATEFLARLIKSKRLRLPKPVKKKVTYHDPCYLGRQSEPPVIWDGEYKIALNCMSYTEPPRPFNRGAHGVYDAPREVLAAVNGLELVEMFRIREYAFCCGGGGGVPRSNPRMAESAARHRLEEARDVGADVLVTACHECRLNFCRAQKSEIGEALPVLDVIDLVFEAAGLRE